MAHKVRTRSRQTPLSWALLAAVPHVNPAAFSSSSIFRRHVVFGLPLFLFPSGVQVSAVFCWQVVANHVDMTKPGTSTSSFFQDEADVLLFFCLVESRVGDGLGPVHFHHLH